MPFTLHVEHDVIGDKTVLEKFEGVVDFNDPPMTSSLHLTFSDGETKKLSYGNVVKAKDNGPSDN